MTEIFRSVRFFDNIGYSCEKAIKNELDEDWYAQYTEGTTEILTTVGVNLLYNVGYMWNDIVSLNNYTPATVPQGDWAFFVFYLFGDFVARIFVNAGIV